MVQQMITKKHGLKKNDLIHGGSLTCINHEENLVISPFGPHLLKGICQFNIGYFFGILEFEKTVSTVTYNFKNKNIKLIHNKQIIPVHRTVYLGHSFSVQLIFNYDF